MVGPMSAAATNRLLAVEAVRWAAWDLLQAIEEDRQPRSSVYDAIHVLEMIHGIYASSLTRRAVAFPLSDRSHPLRACENPTI